MHTKTLAALRADLDNKVYSSRELTQHYLDRIKRYDSKLNAYITVCEDFALAQADAADQQRQAGKATALTGIPIAQKDIFCTQGIKTTCASKMLDNFIAPYNATMIQAFHDAGSVMLGKTNMDEFAMGSSNENSFYGPVKNPWNLDCTPGGSSGGSSAVVAARLAPASTGTDTGGSIRQPAALCNLTGLKPTYGRVSRYGLVAFASSLDQAGPMTQTAEDAAIMMNVMAGHDPKDSTSVDAAVPDYTATLNDSLKGMTLGIPKEYFPDTLDSDIARCIETSIKTLEKLGVTCKSISLPHTHLATSAYYVIAPVECSSNLARFDGVRYGHRCDNPKNLIDLYKRSRGEGFGPEVQRRILIGTYALSAGYHDAHYLKAQKARRLIRDDFVKAFETVDIIATPTVPSTAFRLGEKNADPVAMYLSDIYTIAVPLAGLPGLSIPAGFMNQMPVGLQLIGNYFEEARLLNVGHQFQQVTDWHQRIPEEFA